MRQENDENIRIQAFVFRRYGSSAPNLEFSLLCNASARRAGERSFMASVTAARFCTFDPYKNLQCKTSVIQAPSIC